MKITALERFSQFSLLGMVASGYLAVGGSGFLDKPTLVLAGAALVLRAFLVAGGIRIDISEQMGRLLALSYIPFFAIDYRFVSRDFLSASIHLVFFLASIQILTAKTSRDYLFTAAVAFLELIAAAIVSLEINFILFLSLYLLFAVAALGSSEIRRSLEQPEVTPRIPAAGFGTRLALVSVLSTAGILIFTGGFFFLLPRGAEAAFSRLVSHRNYLLPGFSNQVALGQIGEIKTDSRAVMHIAIFSRGPLPPIKWRGAAFTRFDGRRWSNPDPKEKRIPVRNGHLELESPTEGHRLNYHVQLNAADTEALFFAGTPVRLDLHQFEVIGNGTGSYRLTHVPPPGFAYDAYSVLDEPPEISPPVVPAPQLAPRERSEALQLPPLDRRIPELARRFAAGAVTELDRARAVERHLRHDYAYSLELPSRQIADPLADFLFVRRKGYCEHFASAMTIMLRTLGIPARLVTGFQSGLYNPLTDLWVVRASDAHSWVEAWIPEYGWTTFDPTPPDPNPPGLALFSRLGLYVDAAETFWQDWVVSYDMRRQGTLSYRMESSAHSLGLRWFDSLAGLGTGGWPARAAELLRDSALQFVLLLIAVAIVLRFVVPRWLHLARFRIRVRRMRRGQAAAGDATLLYHRMLQVLKRRGYEKPAWFTPAEFAAALPATSLGTAVGEFTWKYNQWRFGCRTELSQRLSELLDELEQNGADR